MRKGFKIITTLALYLSCCIISASAQKDSIHTIDNVEITAQHKRYNKNNPATELLEKLKQSIAQNNPYKQKFAEYARYEKIIISINDFVEVDSTKALAFLNPHATTNPYTQKTILPISLHHRIVNTTIREHRQKRDTTTFYQKSGIDDYFSQTTVLTFLNDILPEINLFEENVYFAGRKFISPLSKKSQNFYHYFLAPDTLELDSKKYVELIFQPSNNSALAFTGKMLVEIDSTNQHPLLVDANFTVPKATNLNFVSELQINIKYAQDSCNMTVPTQDYVTIDISADKNISLSNITRESIYSNFAYSPSQLPDNILSVDSLKFKPTEAELLTKELSKQLRKRALWVIFEELALIATENYFQTSKPKSYFDIGPISKFLTYNDLEGTKISLGGVTTPNISPYVFFSGLLSYSFKDNMIKGYGTVEWSFTPKKEYLSEYPSNSLAATISYDSKRFSDGFDRQTSRGILDGISRHQYDDLVYQRLYQLRYHKEWLNNMSLKAYGRYYTTYETPIFSFAPTSSELPKYNMSEMELRFGFAPGQKFIQTRTSRYDLHKYIGRFELSHTTAFKGLFGGNYSRNLTTLSGEGRINVQPLGYIDIKGEGGIEWNEVPYMLLPYPKTNTSYFIGEIDYFSMMMPLEFFYDKYIYLGIDYHLDGLIFNQIPIINKLKLREIFTFRGLYGKLSDKNNPLINKNLLSLPLSSSALGTEPYIELGVGIDNILSLFSVNYVWRVTYKEGASLGNGAILFNSVIKF